MTNYHYQYTHTPAIALTYLSDQDNVGHGDHWALLNADTHTLQNHLKSSLDKAGTPKGLTSCKTCDEFLLIGTDEPCHIKQIFALDNGKPHEIINMFPAVNSPYGLECTIKNITHHKGSQDTILRLESKDGTIIYAFDQLYAINGCHYQAGKTYYVSFGAWAYNLSKSRQDEVILVDDPKAIRYHRAFNDIVANNNGNIPDDIDAQIKAWRPKTDEPLAPVEINLGHSCIYLFGETMGQEDEAWCQGQVLGKSATQFLDKDVFLFDVAILREPETTPFVVRIASLATPETTQIQVRDYIQANIWLQGAIYADTQQPKV